MIQAQHIIHHIIHIIIEAIEDVLEVRYIIITLVLQDNQVLIVEAILVAEHQAENRRKI